MTCTHMFFGSLSEDYFLTLCCSLMAPGCKTRPKEKKKKKKIEADRCPVALSVCDQMCVCPCSDLKLRVRILIDGTLIIFRVKPEDAGKYTCSPSNSLGISPSASAYLTVQCECYRGNKVEGEGQADGTSSCVRRTAAAARRLLYCLAALLRRHNEK